MRSVVVPVLNMFESVYMFSMRFSILYRDCSYEISVPRLW